MSWCSSGVVHCEQQERGYFCNEATYSSVLQFVIECCQDDALGLVLVLRSSESVPGFRSLHKGRCYLTGAEWWMLYGFLLRVLMAALEVNTPTLSLFSELSSQ